MGGFLAQCEAASGRTAAMMGAAVLAPAHPVALRMPAFAAQPRPKRSTVTRSVDVRWAGGASAPSAAAGTPCGQVHINSNYDSGNIEIVSTQSPSDLRLAIHRDPYCDTDAAAHAQWFNFRLAGVADTPLTLRITNAGQCSYPDGWSGYAACASYDLEHWFRIPTSYDAAKGELVIQTTPSADAIQIAYFAPYTFNRHRQLIARMQAKPHVRLHMIGETVDGHDLDLLQVGTPGPGKRAVWIIARQHPGESQAEWFADGLLERLTDQHDPVTRALLTGAVLYVVPNANPDGTWRGHLRTNANGANLNRCWAAPGADAPEVAHLLREMDARGVDMLVDVHGDECLPHVFIAGAEGVPRWGPRLASLQATFAAAFRAASPDFQTVHGYTVDAPGEADLRICSNQVAQRFDCLAVTLEMPFKDVADHPEPEQGWSPERSKRLGAAMLSAVLQVLPTLRE